MLTTWIAAVIGSRRVLSVTPMQALGGAEEASEDESRASRPRSAAALVLVVVGALLLVGGIALGQISFSGLLVAFTGGIVSFTGIVLGAHLVIPRALRLIGRLMGGSATTRLAAENAVRYPLRSTRSTIGLLVSVTLITTFGVATRTFARLIEAASGNDPVYYAGIETMLTTVTAVFSVLIGFSAVIAGVGLVNSLSLGVLQRTRELGLLRALGFSAKQLRRMILAESGQLVLTAVALGLVLGTVYGWAGAHSLVGAARGVPGLAFVGHPVAVGRDRRRRRAAAHAHRLRRPLPPRDPRRAGRSVGCRMTPAPPRPRGRRADPARPHRLQHRRCAAEADDRHGGPAGRARAGLAHARLRAGLGARGLDRHPLHRRDRRCRGPEPRLSAGEDDGRAARDLHRDHPAVARLVRERWAPKSFPDRVDRCGNWAVMKVSGGWFGWTPLAPSEVAAN